jgi:small subunit ribosomal protein S1
MVLEIDEERRRISLGMKQCKSNPWEDFAANHQRNDTVRGQIKSITDFGIFVGLPGNIDGLVHLSDLSWNDAGEEVVREYSKGDEVEAVVLSIDADRERISLGIKQLAQDPIGSFVADNPKGSVVSGTIDSVDARGATVDLGNDVVGYIRASDISRDRVEDARTALSEGDAVEARFVGVDRRNRTISLSIRAKDEKDEQQAMRDYADTDASTGTTSLGELLKEQIDASDRNN